MTSEAAPFTTSGTIFTKGSGRANLSSRALKNPPQGERNAPLSQDGGKLNRPVPIQKLPPFLAAFQVADDCPYRNRQLRRVSLCRFSPILRPLRLARPALEDLKRDSFGRTIHPKAFPLLAGFRRGELAPNVRKNLIITRKNDSGLRDKFSKKRHSGRVWKPWNIDDRKLVLKRVSGFLEDLAVRDILQRRSETSEHRLWGRSRVRLRSLSNVNLVANSQLVKSPCSKQFPRSRILFVVSRSTK
jgi:hypothetical protein